MDDLLFVLCGNPLSADQATVRKLMRDVEPMPIRKHAVEVNGKW